MPIEKTSSLESTTSFENLIVEQKNGIYHIRLNRPNARNSLNQGLRLELKQALDFANLEPSIRVIVLSGEGETFCSGADLTERLPGAENDGFVTQLLINEYSPIIVALSQGPKPVIGAVNGVAAGIGMSIALACDFLMMSNDASLYSAFGKISLVPDGGAHWLLSKAIGSKRTYEMIALSQQLTAEKCESLGLANSIVSKDKLIDEALTLAHELILSAPLTLRYSKQLLHKAAEQTLNQTLVAEAEVQNLLLQSEDFKEGKEAFFTRRTPTFKGR